MVSASLVRFDDGVRLEAAKIARACESVGAAFVHDVSQCAGAKYFKIRELGATMAVSSGSKWLLGPYGTGFFWIASEWIERQIRPNARRWDSAETANFTNLAAFDASLACGARPCDVAR